MKFEGQKRIKDLLDGLSQAEGEWRLHVIGDGSDFEKCQAYGRELGISHRLTGMAGRPLHGMLCKTR